MSLKNAQVGDKIKCHYGRDGDWHLYTVVRLTKTQAVCKPEASFRLSDGLKIGTAGSWTSQNGSLATQEDFVKREFKIRLNKVKAAIQNFRVTPENLEAVEAMLKASMP